MELFHSRRAPTYARHGIVASSQPLTAQVGLQVVKEGGNAVDAAIAMAATANVTEPMMNGLGGDAFVIVTKRQWGAFFGTDLDLQLRRRRMTGIVLAGIATSMGVESTARQAFEHGYNVTVAADAVTDLNVQAHAQPGLDFPNARRSGNNRGNPRSAILKRSSKARR
jgi:hypothetical protein